MPFNLYNPGMLSEKMIRENNMTCDPFTADMLRHRGITLSFDETLERAGLWVDGACDPLAVLECRHWSIPAIVAIAMCDVLLKAFNFNTYDYITKTTRHPFSDEDERSRRVQILRRVVKYNPHPRYSYPHSTTRVAEVNPNGG